MTKDSIITALQAQVADLRRQLREQAEQYEAQIADLRRRLNASTAEIEIDHGRVIVTGEARTIVYTDAREVIRK